ncbi:hypothetical protein SEVIR_6G242750v4 [Setaria viridis]
MVHQLICISVCLFSRLPAIASFVCIENVSSSDASLSAVYLHCVLSHSTSPHCICEWPMNRSSSNVEP